LILEQAGLGEFVAQQFGLNLQPELREWSKLVERIKQPRESIRIGLVGKYVELHDAYMSVAESLRHAGWHHDVNIEIVWLNSELLDGEELRKELRKVSGIVVPGGFGPRGIEGKVSGVQFAREKGIPFLGLCYGLHMAVIEAARNLLGLEGANSTEIDPQTPHPVIDLMPNQRGVEMGGTMRLGLWPCRLLPETVAGNAYGEPTVFERHRHRFEVNNDYRDRLAEAGLIVSGASPDGQLAEIMEYRHHPFFVGVQFHPEFRSRPNRPHPLFRDFIAAAKNTLPEGSQRHLPLDRTKIVTREPEGASVR
jgi:CTP synthase